MAQMIRNAASKVYKAAGYTPVQPSRLDPFQTQTNDREYKDHDSDLPREGPPRDRAYYSQQRVPPRQPVPDQQLPHANERADADDSLSVSAAASKFVRSVVRWWIS